MPRGAQLLPSRETMGVDTGIDLDIYQCSRCGLVQLDIDPVPYYAKAIRSTSDSMSQFREEQLSKFIKEFDLSRERIVNIVEDRELDSQFDAFLMFNFLEHLPNPNLSLLRIHNKLTENGVGIVEVPNFDMILQKNLFSEFIRDHLFYFTEDTLNLILRLNGFKILRMESIWKNYILSTIVQKQPKLNLDSFKIEENKLKDSILSYIKKFNSVAIWGAGHQALTLMALYNLGDRISYVVDSSPFKQGRFTPVTHLPIVSPEKLKVSPVEAIIVIVAGFVSEVLGIIKDMKLDTKVAVIQRTILEEING